MITMMHFVRAVEIRADDDRKSFFFFMTCNFFLAVFVWFMIPETKKVPLEEMDTLFGGTSHVQGGALILDVKHADEAAERGERVTRAEQ
jgi:hypothetical protein